MTSLLNGVTVLDLSTVGPATRAAGWLADYGADVVKVGAPAAGTQIAPPPHAYSGGRGTRRIRVDLKHPAGREVFLRLSEHSQVVLESFRPGVMGRLGLGYDDVKSRNPRIVYCSTSGYGQDGPRAQWAGHDLNYLAVGGFLAHTEPLPDGKPPLPGATVADSAGGGMQAVIAILAALVAGTGAYLDVSAADGVLALMSLQADEHLAGRMRPLEPGTAPLGDRYAWYDVYRTSDDRWISVAAIEGKFYANLCRLLDLPDFEGRQYDDSAQDELRAELSRAFATATRDEWVQRLAAADTCVAPVLTPEEAASDLGFRARGTVATAEHPTDGPFLQLAALLAGAERRDRYAVPDQSMTDTDALLERAGYAAEEIRELHAKGVVA